MSGGARAVADLVIFDLDGTLADTLPDIANALNRTLADAGLPPLPLATVVGYVGDGSAKLLERALPPEARGRDLAPLLEAFLAHYEARPCVESRLYPGIAPLLAALAAAGVATAVLTNKVGSVARRLVDAILPSVSPPGASPAASSAIAVPAPGFLAVIGDRDGFPRKPDPAAARSLIERAGTTPARTVIVGDGLPDLRMARALGARSVAAAWGYTPRSELQAESPTWIASEPSAVTGLLLP